MNEDNLMLQQRYDAAHARAYALHLPVIREWQERFEDGEGAIEDFEKVLNTFESPLPPLSQDALEQLAHDADDIAATAARKGLTCDANDVRIESVAAAHHFELGCWLHYYSKRVGLDNVEGFNARVDCARRLFEAGFTRVGYEFFTVFDFGERQFDSIFEMGDADEVIAALNNLVIQGDRKILKDQLHKMGWFAPTSLN